MSSKAPNLGPVDSHIGLDVGGRLTDGGQVDAEEFGALLQRRGDRPRVGRVRFPSPHDDRLDEQVFEEQWNKAAKGNGLGISFKAYSLLASLQCLAAAWQLDSPNLDFVKGPVASMQAGPSRSHPRVPQVDQNYT
jgi:hypothetical protein